MPLASEKWVKAVLSCRPKILKSLSDETLASLNFAAVMAQLLGPQYRESEWLPEDLELGLSMKTSSAVTMFEFCARHYDQLNVYAGAGINRLKIDVSTSTERGYRACSACESLRGSIWTTETIPELPHEKCINKLGCRCLALAGI